MEYLNPYNRYYPANGETSLIDGLYGGFSHGDGFWQGFIGAPFDAIIDLDEIDSLRHIRINFLQNSNAEIWLPKEITIALSNERKGDFEPVATFNNNILSDKAGTFFKSFEWNGSYQASSYTSLQPLILLLRWVLPMKLLYGRMVVSHSLLQ